VFKDATQQKIEAEYLLYTKLPTNKSLKAIVINCPVNKVVCLSSAYLGFISRLNLDSTIVGIDNGDYINNSIVLKNIQNGKVAELAKAGNINYELVATLNPAVIFTYPRGMDNIIVNNKVVTCNEFLETTPLAQAEWIKFIACFYNEEIKADSIFSAIENKYMRLKKLTDTLKNKPTVLTELSMGDTWFIPGGKSYLSILLKDAGADYLFKNDTSSGSIPLSYEYVYNKALGADYWLNLHLSQTKNDVKQKDNRYIKIKAYTNGNLYNNNNILNSKGGNAFWETGVCSPDEVLSDMIKIFHPQLLPSHNLIYYKKLP
jgi:iron complex transport system substrate-binding protein